MHNLAVRSYDSHENRLPPKRWTSLPTSSITCAIRVYVDGAVDVLPSPHSAVGHPPPSSTEGIQSQYLSFRMALKPEDMSQKAEQNDIWSPKHDEKGSIGSEKMSHRSW